MIPRLAAAVLALALMWPAAVHAAGTSWPSVNGPADGSRAVVTGKPTARAALGGYRADLLLWRRIPEPADAMLTGDINGDGRQELICTYTDPQDSDGVIYAVDGNLKVLWRRRGPGLISTPLCQDLDGDGRAEIVVAWRDQKATPTTPPRLPYLETWDGQGKTRWRCDIPSFVGDTPVLETATYPLFAEDLDGDGKCEIGVFHNARVAQRNGYVQPQRKLLFFHERSASPDTSAPLVLYDPTVAIADMNRDGKKEIAVSGYSQADGGEAYGRKDSECQTLLLDHTLKPLTKMGPAGAAIGGVYTRASLAITPPGPRQPATVAAFIEVAAPSRTDRGALRVLDPLTGTVRQTVQLLTRVKAPVAADVTGDDQPELLPLTTSGGLSVYSVAGDPLARELQFRGPSASVDFAADLDLDGKMELVCSPEGNRLALADFSPVTSSFIARSRQAPLEDDRNGAIATAVPWDMDGDGACEVAATLGRQTSAVELYTSVPAKNLVPQPTHQSTGWPRDVVGFTWSPDGRYLVLSDHTGQQSIRRWAGRLGPEVAVVPPGGALAFRPAAGEAQIDEVAVTQPNGVTQDLTIVRLATGASRTLAQGEFGRQMGWAADGRLLLSQRRGQSMDIMAYDPVSGAGVPLAGASDPDLDETAPCAVTGSDAVVFVRRDALPVPAACHSAYGKNGEQGRAGDRFLAELAQALGHPPSPDKPVTAMQVNNLWCVPGTGGPAKRLNSDEAVLRCLGDTAGGPDNAWVARMRTQAAYRVCHIKQLAAIPGTPCVLVSSLIAGLDRPPGNWPPWIASEDLQLANVQTGEMHAVTLDDDQDEAQPAVSPEGRWLAYGATSTTAPKGQIIVTNLTGSSRLVVDSGTAPCWEPGRPGRLWYLQDGRPRYTDLRGWRPEDKFSARTVLYAASGAVAVTGGLFALRIPNGLLLLISAWLLALRRATQTGRSLLIGACLRRLTNAHAALHTLKNTVMFWPTVDEAGATDPVATLEYVFDPENVQAARRGTEQTLRALDAVAVHARADRTVLRELQPETGRQLLEAVELLAASRGLIASYSAKVEQDSQRYLAGMQTSEGPQRAACEAAMANLKGFYQLLTDEEHQSGILDRLRGALREMQVPALLQQVAAAASARATGMGVETRLGRGVNPLQYIPGDPAPLRGILVDAVANSLDAIARRQETAGAGYAGEIVLAMQETEQQFALTVTDNGAGISAELLAQLNAGAAATTKGHSRGSGTIAARRAIAQYPEGRIEIVSEGEGRGAVFTVWLEKV